MIIKIKVKLRKKEAKVREVAENTYEVSLKSSPIENKANLELIDLLSKYFNVSKSNLKFKSGQYNKEKVIEIQE